MGIVRVVFRRDNMLVGVLVLGSGSYLVMFGVNSYWGDYYKKYLQRYDADGQPVPVKTSLDFQFKSVIRDLGFTEWNSKYMKLFINDELDPVSFGSSQSRHGLWIGVPEYFQQSTKEGIMKTNILIDKKPVKWDSADGERFLQSLMLSNNAKRYILAHRVAMHDSYYSHLNAAVPLLMISGAGATGESVYNKLKLHHRPFVLTIFLGVFTLSIFGWLIVVLKDALCFLYDKAAEDRVAELGVNYINGGIEYYTKKIEMNKALRNLKVKGEKYYSAGGNETNIWRAQGMPCTVRLKMMTERLEEFTLKESIKPGPVNPNPHPIFPSQ